MDDEIINLINIAQNDDDIVNLFIKFDRVYVCCCLCENIDKINNKKYLNYFKGFAKNKYKLMKKYYSLNTKLYYFLFRYDKYRNKYNFYAKRSLNYMINKNIEIDIFVYLNKMKTLHFNSKIKDYIDKDYIFDKKYCISFILKK